MDQPCGVCGSLAGTRYLCPGCSKPCHTKCSGRKRGPCDNCRAKVSVKAVGSSVKKVRMSDSSVNRTSDVLRHAAPARAPNARKSTALSPTAQRLNRLPSSGPNQLLHVLHRGQAKHQDSQLAARTARRRRFLRKLAILALMVYLRMSLSRKALWIYSSSILIPFRRSLRGSRLLCRAGALLRGAPLLSLLRRSVTLTLRTESMSWRLWW